MAGNDKFTLYVYDGDFGLPSLNVDCVQTILYTSISKVPVQLKILNNIKHCLFYSAPCFVHKNVSVKSFPDIVLYLRTLGFNLDSKLTPKQRSESLAISNLVQSKLKVVVEYVLWIDQRNCDEFSRVWFARALPTPFNMLHPKKFKENAINLVESLYPNDYNMEFIKDYLSSVATECLSSLSARLGTFMYFYGEEPTTLDVIVYSYIAFLQKLPFPSNNIPGLVALWPNLINFIKRMDEKYLPEVPKESKYIKNEDKSKTNDEEVSYVAISILTISAMSLVLGFAVSKGFLPSKMFSY